MLERETGGLRKPRQTGLGGGWGCMLHQAQRRCSCADSRSLLSRLPGIWRDTDEAGALGTGPYPMAGVSTSAFQTICNSF